MRWLGWSAAQQTWNPSHSGYEAYPQKYLSFSHQSPLHLPSQVWTLLRILRFLSLATLVLRWQVRSAAVKLPGVGTHRPKGKYNPQTGTNINSLPQLNHEVCSEKYNHGGVSCWEVSYDYDSMASLCDLSLASDTGAGKSWGRTHRLIEREIQRVIQRVIQWLIQRVIQRVIHRVIQRVIQRIIQRVTQRVKQRETLKCSVCSAAGQGRKGNSVLRTWQGKSSLLSCHDIRP